MSIFVCSKNYRLKHDETSYAVGDDPLPLGTAGQPATQLQQLNPELAVSLGPPPPRPGYRGVL